MCIPAAGTAAPLSGVALFVLGDPELQHAMKQQEEEEEEEEEEAGGVGARRITGAAYKASSGARCMVQEDTACAKERKQERAPEGKGERGRTKRAGGRGEGAGRRAGGRTEERAQQRGLVLGLI